MRLRCRLHRSRSNRLLFSSTCLTRRCRRAPNAPNPRSLEEPGSEIVEAPPPRQPFMGRAGRLEVDVLDSDLRQLLTEVLCPGPFHRADPEEENFHLLVEGVGIGEDAVV